MGPVPRGTALGSEPLPLSQICLHLLHLTWAGQWFKQPGPFIPLPAPAGIRLNNLAAAQPLSTFTARSSGGGPARPGGGGRGCAVLKASCLLHEPSD